MARSPLAFFLALPWLLAAGLLATPAQAQEELLPDVSFGVRAMQGAQFIRTDDRGVLQDDEAAPGFQRPRYNLEVTAAFGDRVLVYADLGHEPNDFGTGSGGFAPAVDYLALDLLLSDQYTLRLGTPVTSLFQYRGYSDGAAVQSNPLIGNSPADFITAETGAQFAGALDEFSFDLTLTAPTFFQDFTPGTGPTAIAKAGYQINDQVGIGAAVGHVFSGGAVDRYFDDELSFGEISGAAGNWVTADGENYVFPSVGQPTRITHAQLLPGFSPTLLQAEVGFAGDPVAASAWGGYGFESRSFSAEQGGAPTPQGSALTDEDSQMRWLGGTLQFNATERFYVAGRGTLVQNASDWAEDDTNLFRIQAGLGLRFFDVALFKLEYVRQTEQANSPGQLGADWQGVSAELSVGV